jgi:protein-S-isoprenylcysteine O-methyltransferase Ste14
MLWVTLLGMAAYGVLHTLMAGQLKPRFAARFGQRAYEGLYRIVFNGVSLVSFVPVGLMVLLAPAGVVWAWPAGWAPLLWLVQAVGLVGLIASVMQIDAMRFLGVSQFVAYRRGQPLPLPDEPLTTGGLYGLVRHPLYLFSLLAIWPVGVMTEAYLGMCLGVTAYFLIGSVYEERRLLAAFGDSYAQYRQRVPRIVPFWPRHRA